MAIEAYPGVPGLAINVTTPDELHEALDALHTQVIDNLPERISAPYVEALEKAMEAVQDAIGEGHL